MLRTLQKHHAPTVLQRVSRTALLAAVLACASAQAWAATFYVDGSNPAASDLNIGTELQPYLTINGAIAAHKGADVTILVKPGVYREQVSVPTSGAAGFPFVIQATGPGTILDGSEVFSDPALWSPTTGTVFLAASVNWTAAQVLVDGARLTKATVTSGDALPAGQFLYVAGQGLYVNLGGDNPGAHSTLVSKRNFGFTLSTKMFVTIAGFEITRTNDRGINVFGCSDLVIAGNTVTFANSYGIQAVGSTNLLIERNLVTDSNFHGIGLTSGSPGVSTNCVVRFNECARNAHPTIRQANGIYLSGAPGNTIHGNRLHHNQDTGMHFAAASNDCLSYNNISYANGDHGYDHLATLNVTHLHDVAHGNHMDGFSFEGNSPGGRVYNCVAVDNGLTTNEYNLWVDATSSAGFLSDHNLFWNSTLQPPVKFGAMTFALLGDFTLNTGLDANSRQANPMFADAALADFRPLAGSPLIDAARSDLVDWPAVDAVDCPRLDDKSTPDAGVGPVTFADMGALEFVPPSDLAPVVTAAPRVIAIRGTTLTFAVGASDPDGDAIQSLTMLVGQMPKNAATPQFVVNAEHTEGTFTWQVPNKNGNARFSFIGANALADTAEVQVQIRGATNGPGGELATDGEFEIIALSGGYPMPTAGAVEFALTLPSDESVDWGVFDAQGRRVWSESRLAGAGQVRLRWSGVDRNGRRAATGVYFARVRVGETEFVRRIVRN